MQMQSQAIKCKCNPRQMQVAWLTYTHDNQDVMPLHLGGNATDPNELPGSWVMGDA
jgi:hypothetical protein